ncbi:16S rRNA (cytidine(1402)-2'-O)-methyltransferase [Lentibacter sp. XHP0401]|uniref:16S rRNA (cytidine(1402)-2'-O)-methyltransferase n=1 Tax=Lentibacter sp. XHP0401 TaxID=2984334 RepID=UPI0021E80859|nr:16S rRNA (cytidine(1402)-2'-O)-methyltransferase [Lentibacter sp. XHP0401]MCV2894048.1 16S rRNA (cytidine(1402)-2'-O)-methyltransferase [Lentibacter sp. XHP0401]
MNHKESALEPMLYLLATPLGTARDITLRTLDVLASADVLAAEDTRTLKKLMEIHGIPLKDRPVIAYHDHNGERARPKLLKALAAGQSVAYASEAGTPMIADPGYHLVREVQAAGFGVTSLPGPSAVITALTLGGLPTDIFTFAGFLPSTKSARRKALKSFESTQGTLVFYESPKRIAAMISDAGEVLGADREGRVCRELTKKFEEVISGTLRELSETLAERSLKGEIVVLIGKGTVKEVSREALEKALTALLEEMSLRDAADRLAQETGVKRRDIYQIGLDLQKS